MATGASGARSARPARQRRAIRSAGSPFAGGLFLVITKDWSRPEETSGLSLSKETRAISPTRRTFSPECSLGKIPPPRGPAGACEQGSPRPAQASRSTYGVRQRPRPPTPSDVHQNALAHTGPRSAGGEPPRPGARPVTDPRGSPPPCPPAGITCGGGLGPRARSEEIPFSWLGLVGFLPYLSVCIKRTVNCQRAEMAHDERRSSTASN